MGRLISCCAILVLTAGLHGCSDRSMGVSLANESSPAEQSRDRPEYIRLALQRAEQLSTEPAMLLALCESDLARATYPDQKALVRALNICIENAGME